MNHRMKGWALIAGLLGGSASAAEDAATRWRLIRICVWDAEPVRRCARLGQ